ncbi:MAG: hypothetical protein M5U15_00770 [Kiritimatiellae bacterium]|nr:hypothetical protein [Kiritimatiellia bacterium]
MIEWAGEEIEAAEVKENIGYEALPAPVAIGFLREAVDIAIDRLREGVGEMMPEACQNAPHIGFYSRLKLAAIQMPPSLPLGSVNVGARAAHRTAPHLGSAARGHHDRQRRHVYVCLLHKPQLFQPQQSLIQLGVFHSQSLRDQARIPRDFSESLLSKGVLSDENT